MPKKQVDYGSDPTHGHPKNRNSKYETHPQVASTVRWGEIDADTLRACIDAVTYDGCAIIFSRTSDGGALAYSLLDGLNRHKRYASTAREATEELERWTDAATTPDLT